MNSRIYFVLIAAVILQISSHKLHAQDEDMKQAARDLVEVADEAFEMNLALDIVREQYEQAAGMDPENIKANYMTGELYIQRGPEKERATKFLLKVLELDPNYRFDILYKIGQGYQYGLQFDKAVEFYNRYKDKLLKEGKAYRGADKVMNNEVDRRIFECANGKKYVAAPENYSIVNAGEDLNSSAYDFAPVLNQDESVMIFTTRRQEANTNENVDNDNYHFEDIFISRKGENGWLSAENIGLSINTPYHDSNLALTADGKTLYLYRDENGGDIYFSDLLKTGEWSAPQPLPGNINSSYFENGVSISPDKNTLFFSSDRPGGYGGRDIYMCVKDSKGAWSRVTNLGQAVNTIFDDEGPFIDYDGKTLYFSSRGHDGMGGFDIYVTEYDSAAGEWITPVNLGYPINTPDDDIYFVSTKDRKRGYYSSVRDDGRGYTDIYLVEMPDLDERIKEKQLAKLNPEIVGVKKNDDQKIEKVDIPRESPKPALHPVTLLVRVEDQESRRAMDASLMVRTMNGNVMAPVQRVEEGVYQVTISNPEPTDYMISIEKQGFVFRNSRMMIPAAGEKPVEIKRRFELKRFEVGARDVLRNIYFRFDNSSFTKESYFELNKLERMLYENPNFMVEIAGHTDNIGTWDYNKKLSLRRANAVVSYLVGKGIDARRIKGMGYGETKPLASNDDEKDGREINRRVEFVVIADNFNASL